MQRFFLIEPIYLLVNGPPNYWYKSVYNISTKDRIVNLMVFTRRSTATTKN